MVKKQKVGAIIQARMNSTRLPGKVLMPLPVPDGNSILEHVIIRAEKSKRLNQIIVATSRAKSDDTLAAFSEQKNYTLFRGSEEDVLSRFYEAATLHELDVIVRLTADNPYFDPETIAAALEQHLVQKNDYTRTTGLPLGMNIEIMTYQALKTAFEEAESQHDREHVTSCLYTNPEKFRVGFLPYQFPEKTFSDFRLTIDYPSDFALANLVFSNFQNHSTFGIKEIYPYWEENRWLQEINNTNFQKRVYTDPAAELKDAVNILKFYNLETAANRLLSEIEK